MGRLYQPCEFRLKLDGVDLRDISSRTLCLVRDDRYRIDSTISVDHDAGIVYLKPKSRLLEFSAYKFCFSKTLRFQNGKAFPHSYSLIFRIKNGRLYAPKDGEIPTDINEFFSSKNLLLHTAMIWITFNENIRGSNLSYRIEQPKPPSAKVTDVRPEHLSVQRTSSAEHTNSEGEPKRRTFSRSLPVCALVALLILGVLSWFPSSCEREKNFVPDLSVDAVNKKRLMHELCKRVEFWHQ